MFQKLSPFLAAIAAAVLAALGARYLPAPNAPVAPPPTTTPQSPAPSPGPQPAEDTKFAIVQIQIGNSGCTATIIDAKRSDGRYWLLTAAHCVGNVGQRGAARLRDGREFAFAVQSFDRTSDCAWLLSEPTTDTYPFALMADGTPEVGEAIWHAGFGVDRPGNVEKGVLVAKANRDGQVQYNLNVSSGDSGGGIAMTKDGKVISPVCCTTAKGQYASVWGASPESCRTLRPKTSVADTWTPIEIPIREVPKRMPEKE